MVAQEAGAKASFLYFRKPDSRERAYVKNSAYRKMRTVAFGSQEIAVKKITLPFHSERTRTDKMGIYADLALTHDV